MPTWLEWTLIGIGGVATLYVLFLFIVLFIISKFNQRLKKRREALRLLLAQRKDITLGLFKLVVEAKIKIPLTLKNKISELANKEIGLFNSYEIFDYAPEVIKITKALLEVSDESKSLKKNEKVEQFRKELTQLDEIKRQHIAIYNSDINGYNYWIGLMSYRHILSALGYHPKKRIE